MDGGQYCLNIINFPLYIPLPALLSAHKLVQWLNNLEIPVLVQSLKSSKVKLGYYLDGRLFKCCLSAAAYPFFNPADPREVT